MSIRGEITEAQKRQGDRIARENRLFDEEESGHPAATPPPVPASRPPTLYEAGPWMARIGLRCGRATLDPGGP